MENRGPTVNLQQVNFVKLHLETNPTQSSNVWLKCPERKVPHLHQLQECVS